MTTKPMVVCRTAVMYSIEATNYLNCRIVIFLYDYRIEIEPNDVLLTQKKIVILA